MNNLEDIKECLKKDEFLRRYIEIRENEIDNLTPEQIAKSIDMDCTVCLCYGCRLFTHNYNGNLHPFHRKECYNYIVDYFSRDFNPDTDLCQCPSCKRLRGESLDKVAWKLSYNNKTCEVYENSLSAAKSEAINLGLYQPEDFPYIKGKKVKDEKSIH